jgi:crotonobetainyl-CoA:carnitine CoA-transferase CaiB-like acyl-CoA transferase
MDTLPLSGIRVVALEQAVAAPFCSRQLGDLGADVVKVERPDGGDFAREYDHALNGLSAYFAWLNRGKRSAALDIKAERDREALRRLVARADVLLHNFAPGAIERLGLGYDELRVSHPRLIWCGISGYGPDGPYRDRKAYDMLVQGEAGAMSITGTPDAPAKVGMPIADIAAGMYAYSSILAALFARERTGRGDRIDISMFESLVEWMSQPVYWSHGTGRLPVRPGMRHSMVVPYGLYSCSNGQVNLSIQNEREWRRFCDQVLLQPEVAEDPRFAGNANRCHNRDELETAIEAVLTRHSCEEILRRLVAAELPVGSVNDVAAVAKHPQLEARNRWGRIGSEVGDIPALKPPQNLQSAPPPMGRVPGLGEHTREILAEIGMEAE